MALSFPPSPAIGDIYLQWQWNGSAWGPIPGGSGGGSVSITAGTGITVSPSPLTGTGTVGLSTPVAISTGGTNATTAGAGADNLHGFSGSTAGLVRRTGSATYALDSASYLTANQTITLSGDVSGSGTTAITATLPTVNANVGTFQGITVNAKGLVTAAANQSYAPLASPTFTGTVTSTGNITANGADGLKLYAPGGSSSRVYTEVLGVRSWLTGTLSDGTWNVTDFNAGPATRIRIDGSGSCQNATGSWTTLSDERLKLADSIKPYERGLDACLALSVVQYRYAPATPFTTEEEPGPLRFGLVAQDVQSVIPEIVVETSGMVNGEEVPLLGLNAGDLVYVLINAVKSLHERLTAAEAQIPSQGLGRR